MFLQTPHNNRRWEWMLLPGEDREAFLQDETIHAILEPHVDVSKIDIYRRRVYDFHSILADSFQRGRIFLAGDAAHMTPPFAGQGLNSGVRDVTNLGWKLITVLKGQAAPDLLDSYEPERWTHAKQLIDTAVMLGQQIQPLDPEAAAQRDAMFFAMQEQPGELEKFENNLMHALLDRYFDQGFAVDIGNDYLAGRMISQPWVTGADGTTVLLDRYLGPGFAIIGYNCDPTGEMGPELSRAWQERGVTLLSLDDSGSGEGLALEKGSHLADLFSQSGGNMILLRPDRFCMAVFTSDNAADVLGQAAAMLDGEL
jgi:3-(3-hydroxy-phenyl)propionate hydroxylase